MAGVRYMEWRNANVSRTVFHWHYADRKWADKKDVVMRRGSQCCGPGMYFSFWINQDTFVDVPEIQRLMDVALAGPAV